MKNRIAPALLGSAVALVLAAPAQAVAPPPTKLFFKCVEPSKVQNTALVTDAVSWEKTAPTASYTEGAGCGYGDVGGLLGTNYENIYDGVFGGDYAGAITKIDVELHNLVLSQVRQGTSQTLNVRLTVDGEEWANQDIAVTPTLSDTGASELFKFSLADLDIPAGSEGRRVILTVNTDAFGAAAWVFGAKEIASNATLFAPDPDATPTTATRTATRAKAKLTKAAKARKLRRARR